MPTTDLRAFLPAVLTALLAGCSTPPTTPSASRPPASPPSEPSPNATFSVSGVVLGGERPIQGAKVSYFVLPPGGPLLGTVKTGPDGQFAISNLPSGAEVKVHAVDWQQHLFQQCPARTVMNADKRLELEVVAAGQRGARHTAPSVTGVVFETIGGVRRPLRDTPVAFCQTPCRGMVDVFLRTGGDGRFDFCAVPEGPAEILAGDCNDQSTSLRVDIRGDTVVDVDLTNWIATCPFTARSPGGE